MPFSDIVGHQKRIETLKRALETHRLHHAYLFVGPEGVGKKTIALALAMAVHCEKGPNDFCGCCQSCQNIQDENHPDVRIIRPPPGKKEIGIPQIRELERDLTFRSFLGRKKVAILDSADVMNYHAQNCLLKTLEEPPGDSLLILIATRIGTLLPTLLSRCLRLSFGVLPIGVIADILVRQKRISAEEAKLVAHLTMGSLGEALSTDREELVDKRKEWLGRLNSLCTGDYREVLALAEEIGADREQSLKFLRHVTEWYRDILVYQVAGKTEQLRNIDMEQTLREKAELFPLSHTLAVLARTGEGSREIQGNYNRRMVLENVLIRIVSDS